MDHRYIHLFDGWDKTMVWTCLQGHMGQVMTEGTPQPVSALCAVGDFCFLAGLPSRTLTARGGAPHSGPSNSGLGTSDPGRLGGAGRSIPPLCHPQGTGCSSDRGWLTDCAAALPEGVVLSPICAGLMSHS